MPARHLVVAGSCSTVELMKLEVNPVELTVLGCYGPYPPAGGACSGYLIEEDGYRILLECGNGIMSRLQAHLPFPRLDAVIVSHLHSDHISDLMILRYGLEMALARGERDAPLPLYAPPEPEAEFQRLPYKSAYRVIPVHAGERTAVGPFQVTFQDAVHAIPGLAMRIESPRGAMAYSGDTGPCRALEQLAREADLFLCEANYQEADAAAAPPYHLSAAGAARVAAAAGARSLLLTHLHPARDGAVSLAEARAHYRAAGLAREGQRYRVGGEAAR